MDKVQKMRLYQYHNICFGRSKPENGNQWWSREVMC